MRNHITAIPPLIILSGGEHTVCEAGTDPRPLLAPEAMRGSDAFVIHDPDKSLWNKYAATFNENGYAAKAFDLTDIKRCRRYNPFAYLRDEGGVQTLADALIGGTQGLGEPGDTDFVSRETLLLTALIGFIYLEAPDYEMKLWTLIYMLEHMIQEGYEDGDITAVDYLIMEKGEKEPEHFAVRKYSEYEDAVGGDARRVIASCIARLAPLNTPATDFMTGDDILLDLLSATKTALFVISGEPGADFGFIARLMYAQLFDLLRDNGVL